MSEADVGVGVGVGVGVTEVSGGVGEVDDRYERFRGLVPPEVLAQTRVCVVGCGGIGSWVTMGLACLGVQVAVYDYDKTERVNYGGQPLQEVGESKVWQVQEMVGKLAVRFEGFVERVGVDSRIEADVWVSGLDSIDGRKEVWTSLKRSRREFGKGKPFWYVDGRMGGLASNVLSVEMGDKEAVKAYEASLEPVNGFQVEPCTLRTTVFAGMGTAAQMVAEVVNALKTRRKEGGMGSRQVNTDWLSHNVIRGWTA